MKEKLKIKISIGDRVYPLSIFPEQEEGLRKAAKEINSMMKKYEQSYAVRDKQDVLAMCALQFANQLENINKTDVKNQAEMLTKLKDLNKLVENNLN
ncbi:MAG: cell division protein ZapA [Flavobacteriaceae bacterium]|nr:cell division protein ZapA [Flavobacteriaceae bacterium]